MEASFTPQWISPDSAALDRFHRVSAFELTNQNGEPVTRASVEGRIYVADFFFTTCGGICPKMTRNMLLLQDAFRDDEGVRFLSHSVTPEHDTVDVLKQFEKRYGIDGRQWDLVTGDQAQIYDLGRRAYFVEEDLGQAENEDDFLHTENFVLVDGRGHIRGVYNGLNKAAIKLLIANIRSLKEESI